jgi:metallo-beta-lactamase class B
LGSAIAPNCLFSSPQRRRPCGFDSHRPLHFPASPRIRGEISWVGLGTLLLVAQLRADENPEWTAPIAPFRIVGNLYYVGSRDLASYLIVTPAGDILINSNLESSAPLIRSSVEQLGFHFQDIKILLISHAHWDHDSSSAEIKRQTGAKYEVMDGDVPVVESGGERDFAYPDKRYPAAKVDRVLHDGDTVRLGDAVLIAHKTPGHTHGCTTWTLQVKDGGKPLNVVIVGSWNVNSGYRLVDQPGQPASYPGIAADYQRWNPAWFTKEGYYTTITAHKIAAVSAWLRVYQNALLFSSYPESQSFLKELYDRAQKLKAAFSTGTCLWYYYFDAVGERLIEESEEGASVFRFAKFCAHYANDTDFRLFFEQLHMYIRLLGRKNPKYLDTLPRIEECLQDLIRLLEKKNLLPGFHVERPETAVDELD